MRSLANFLDRGRDFGLLVLRIVVGATFIYFGWTKIIEGQATWEGVGSAVSNFGLTEGYVYWGLAAAIVEFLGGVALIIGYLVRPAALFLFGVMVTATVLKARGLDFSAGATVIELFYPASMAAVMVSLFFSGAGKFSPGYQGKRTSSVVPKAGD